MLHQVTTLGESDCETIANTVLAQPVNAFSSFAFSIVGIGIIAWAQSVRGVERELRIVFGTILILTGIGSYLFHGPQPPVSQFLHDITFLAALFLIVVAHIATGLSWSRPALWGVFAAAMLVVSVILVVYPQATNTLMVAAVAGVVLAHLVMRRVGPASLQLLLSAILAMALGVTFFVLGRAGGPICDPGSVFQGHAMWHILSAVGIGAYFVATSPPRLGSLGSAQ